MLLIMYSNFLILLIQIAMLYHGMYYLAILIFCRVAGRIDQPTFT